MLYAGLYFFFVDIRRMKLTDVDQIRNFFGMWDNAVCSVKLENIEMCLSCNNDALNKTK